MPAIISGTVFDDLNSNGTFDPGEPGIPNAFVVLEDTTGSCVTTQTDANGNYSFTNLTVAGTYTVYETVGDPGATCPPTTFTQPSGFSASTTPRQISVNVTQNDIDNDIDLSGNDFGHDDPDDFGCQSFAWQVATNPTNSDLFRINLATGATNNTGTVQPPGSYNGIGYNPTDGNIWGQQGGSIVRITSDRQTLSFNVPNLPVQNYNIGDVDQNGYLYLTQGQISRFYVVDVNPNRATYGLLVDPATGFQIDTAPFGTATNPANIADWAFNPNDGFIYALNNTTGNVLRFDPVTGARIALTTNPSPTATVGAVFFDSGNNLYTIDNNTGAIGRYNIVGTTATRTAFSVGQPAQGNDGARCATAPIEFAEFDTNKSATQEVGVGDTITYTITLDNVGTTTANSVTFVDTIPNGTTFVPNSLTLDGGGIPGNPEPPGASLGSLSVGLHTVTFQVVVDTIPSPNPTPNVASGSFSSDDPLVGTTVSGYNTNVASTTVNFAIIHSTKSVDITNAAIGDTLTYTIELRNTGNTTTTSITFIDTIPNGTTFVANSLFQDATPVVGNPNPPGVLLPNDIGIGGVSTVTFSVVVTSLPNPNPIPNNAAVPFEYTGDPSVPTTKSGDSATNTVNTFVSLADLGSITKSVDLDFGDIGDTVTYTIAMTNNGNVTATNVEFVDTIPNDTTFVTNSFTENGSTLPGENPQNGVTLQDIPGGNTTTVTFQATVDTIPSPNPIPNLGEVSYTYTADPSVPDGESGRDVSNRVLTQVNSAELELNKVADPEFADIGDTITYTVVLSNTGNVTATNVNFSDTIPNGTTFVTNSFTENGSTLAGENPQNGVTLQDIPAGGATTVTFQVIVDTIPSSNPIENIAVSDWTYTVDPSVPDGGSSSSQSNTADSQVNNADLELVKSADVDNAGIGDTITYTVVLSNTGNVTATNVNFSDTIPNGTSLVPNSFTENGVTVPGADPEAGVGLNDIPGGGVTTVTFQVVVDTVPSPNPIENTAISDWNYTIDPSVPDGGSGEKASNTIQTNINDANLDLVKAVDLEYADIGDTITYTIVITNSGNATANNVVFSDTIPNDTTFVSNSVTVDGVTQPGADPQSGVSLSSIAPGGVTTVTFQVTVDTVPSPNPIPNSGDAAWTFTSDPSVPDGESGRDTSNTVDTEVNNADLELVKTSDPEYADVGDTITYTVVLSNTGNVSATNVNFSDTIPNGTSLVSNSFTENGVAVPGADPEAGVSLNDIPGGGVTTVTFQVVVDTIPSTNPIQNTAVSDWTYTVDPSVPDGGSGSTQSNTTDNQVNNANLDLVKVADAQFADVGDTLTYTIVITNNGNVVAENVVFTDTIPTDTTFVTDSVTINGVQQPGANPESGVSLSGISAGEVVTVTFQVIVDTVPNPNPIQNSADAAWTYTVDPSIPNGASDRDTSNTFSTQINDANLEQNKVADPEFLDIGDTITYTVVLTNTGNVTATNVNFSDTIPNGTTYVSDSLTENGLTIPGANPEAGVTLNNIPSGGVTTVTFQVVVDTIPSPNPIENISVSDWTYTIDPSVPDGGSSSSQSNPAENQVNNADLELVKSADVDNAGIGDTVTYTIVLSNTGNVSATNVSFSDTIPNGTSLVPNSFTENGVTVPGADPEAGVGLNDIPGGGVTTVTFQVVVDTVPSPNPIENIAISDWTYTTDPSVPDGESGTKASNSVETNINDADLDLVKAVDLEYADIGDTITYSIVITNSGNVTANNVVFSDTIPNDTTFVSNSVTVDGVTQPGADPQSGVSLSSIAPGGVTTVTFQVTVDTVPSPNPIPNSGDAAWTFTSDPSVPDGESGRDTSNTVDTQVNNADLELVKTSAPSNADIGDTITYTVVLRNTGNVSATNITFSDTIPSGTTYIANTFAENGVVIPGADPEAGVSLNDIPGGGVTTVTFQVMVDTIPSPNPIQNIAVSNWNYTVDPSVPDGGNGSSQSNPTDNQVNNANLDLVKIADAEFADVGDTLTYTVVVTNNGNVTANNVVFTDTIPNDTSFIANTVTINGVQQPGVDPEFGINLPAINAGESVTITFQVSVDTIPSPNPILNSGDAEWTYTVDPSDPNGASGRDTSNVSSTEINNANLDLSKTSDPEFADVGDTITYTIVLRNVGNTTANNVVFSDTIPNDTTFVQNSVTVNGVNLPGENPAFGVSIGNIAPGAVATIMFQVTVDTIPSPNPVVNSGVANYVYTVDPSIPNGANGSDISNESETQINNANISNGDGGLVKVVDPEFAVVGETLTYTIVIQNTGNADANNVMFSDTIPNDTTFVNDSVRVNGVVQPGVNPETGVNIGTIAPGQVVTVTFQVTVDTIPSLNPIPNTGIVNYDYTVDPSVPNGASTASATNTVNSQISQASISNGDGGLVKSVDPEFAKIGDTLTYTIVLQNTGNTDANQVVFNDTIPSGTTFVTNSVDVNGVNQPGANPEAGVPIGVIAPGEVVTVTFQVVVDTIPSPNTVENTARVSYAFTSDPSVPNGNTETNDSNTVDTEINQATISNADGGIVKSVDPESADVGDTLTYTIVLKNTGNTNANNVVVNDTIPSGTSFVPNSTTINGAPNAGNPETGISVGSISPGQVVTVMFQVVVDTIPSPNPIANIANVSYTFTTDPSVPDGESDRNSSNETNAQINNADIEAVKTTSVSDADLGDTITYTIELRNNGNVTATNVVFSDTIPNGLSFVGGIVVVDGTPLPGDNPESGIDVGEIPPGAISTITFRVTVATIPSPNPAVNQGSVSFNYTVDPSVPNGATGGTPTNRVPVQVSNADVELVKSASLDFAGVGDTITYTIVATNTGNVVANNVVVSDTIPNDTTFVPDSVTVGGGPRPGENPEAGISIGSLNAGQSVTITFQVVVDTIPSPNPITNVAISNFTYTVDPSVPDGESGSNASNGSDTLISKATISNDDGGLVKSVDPEFADVGDTITYTIVLQNTGNVPANNVVLNDTIPSGTTFVTNSVNVNGVNQPGENPQSGITIGTINPGAVVTVTFEVVVDTIPSPNPIANTADVSYDFIVTPGLPPRSERNTTNEVDTQVNRAEISNESGGLVKSVDKTEAKVGDTLTYTTVIENTGNVTANNVVFTDTIPDDTTFVPASVVINGIPEGSENPSNGINLGAVSAGEVITVTFLVTIDTIPSPNPIPNTSQIEYTYTVDPSVPNGESVLNVSNLVRTQVNQATISNEAGGLTKSVDREFADIGDTITYTIVLKNTGNVNANNVIVSDTIPNDTTFVPNSVTINGVPSASNPQTGINVGSITPNQVVTVTFSVTVDVFPSPNPIPNTADVAYTFTVNANDPNGESERNTSNEVTTQVNVASISNEDGGLVKIADPEFAAVGETITYTIVLQNTGNVTATNVVVNDTIPNGTTFVPNSVTLDGLTQAGVNPQTGITVGSIGPGVVRTVTFQVVVDTVPSPNPIANSADVSYNYTSDPSIPNGGSDRNTSNEVETTVNNADIQPDKSANPEFADVGDTITFTTVLRNTGNIPANNVVFTDTIPNDTTFVPNSVRINGVVQGGADPESGINIGTINPGAVVTVSFDVVVDTIPSPNPIVNIANVSYSFTSDPSIPNGESRNVPSNEAESQVNTASISNRDGGFVKSVDSEFADVGDTLTFTMVLENTGNVSANNVVFSDTIPNDTTFVPDSVTVNGVVQPGANPESGVNIGTIGPNEIVTVTFRVTVDTIPSPNPVSNIGRVNYDYTVDPSVPNGASDEQESNEVESQINNASISNRDGGFVKSVDKVATNVGDTLTYTIVLQNTGNVTANNVVVSDTIPNDTTLVPDSVTVNGVTQPGANPESGINVGSIPPLATTTVTFRVTIDTIPSPNPIENTAIVNYDYTVDPSVPNGASDEQQSNTVETQANTAIISNDDGGFVKSSDPEFVDIGDTITYTIVAKNTGNVAANNVVVNDTIPSGTTFVPDSVTLNGVVQPGVNPQSGVNVGTLNPNQVATITFQVVVDTIPTVNPVPNSADVSYTFTADPSVPDGESVRNPSNEVENQVNNATISNDANGFNKSVDPEFAAVGDTITYTIILENTGNVSANNLVFTDTIPSGTTLVPNSLRVNGVIRPADSPEDGVNIGTIGAGEVVTVMFQVVVDTIPTVNPIQNEGNVTYDYTVDPSVPNGESNEGSTNVVETTVNNADISNESGGLQKSVDKADAAVGDTITFTIFLQNNGNVPANNVVVSDTIPNGTSFIPGSVTLNGVTQPGANPETGVNIGTLGAGASATLTFQVRVDTIPSPNPIVNSADVAYTFTSDPNDPDGEERRNTSNETESNINFANISNEDGGFVKSVDPEFADVGDTITYTIIAMNTGNVTANNVVVSDTVPSGTTFVTDSVTVNGATQPGVNPSSISVGSIAPNASATITFQVVVDLIPSPNPVPNSADVAYTFTADPNDPDGQSDRNTSNEVDTQVNNANISNEDGGFTKSADPEFAKVGETITYTIVATNTGNVPANNVIISDTIPSGTTFVADSVRVNGVNQGGVNIQNGVNVGTINPGATTTVTFQVIVDTIPTINPIANSARIDYSYTVDPSIPNGSNGSDLTNEVDTQVNDADIEPEKTADKEFADIGDTITYTITAKNTGNVTATNVVITDTIPGGTTLVQNSVMLNGVTQPGANPQNGINVGSISPGGTAVLTFQVVVEEIPTDNPTVNQASINYTFTKDPNNQDGEREGGVTEEVPTQVNTANISNEDGGFVKSVDKEFAEIGETITYTIVLTNTGNVNANNVVFSDTIPSGAAFIPGTVTINGTVTAGVDPQSGITIGTIAPGETVTVTFSIFAETIPSPNPLVNQGRVNFDYTVDPSIPNGSSDEQLTNTVESQINDAVIDNESGGLIKSADPEFADIGDTITYTVVIQNKGNVPANNVVFTDPIPEGTTFVENSVTVNGAVQGGVSPASGINLGTINPGVTVTVTFRVVVDELPSVNPIPNMGTVDYTFTKDPNIPNGESRSEDTNETETQVNRAQISTVDGGLNKNVDPDFADIGETLTYTITLMNTGNIPAQNVTFTDTIPNGTMFVTDSVFIDGTQQPGANPESGILIGTINPNETKTITFQVVVETIPSPDPIVNTGIVDYGYAVDPNDPTLTNVTNLTNEEETKVNHGEISNEAGGFTKSSTPEFVDVGDTITYTIVAKNTGNVDVNNVVVTDEIPSGTSFIPGTVSVNGAIRPAANPENGINIGTITPNTTVTIMFQVVVETIPSPNPIGNEADVSYDYLVDPNEPPVQMENTSNRVENTVRNANISTETGGLQKIAEPEFADIGDTITYTIVMKNTGNVSADNVVVNDTIPEGTSLVANSVTVNGIVRPGANPESGINVGSIGAGMTTTVMFQVVVETIPSSNPIVNVSRVDYEYTVDPNEPPREESSNTNPEEVQVNHGEVSKEAGGFIKTADLDFADVGDTITYTIVARNTGNVDVNNAVIEDPIPSGTTFVQGSLEVNGTPEPGSTPSTGIDIGTIQPNETFTITFQVVVQEIPSPNPISNVASISYDYLVDPEGPPVEVENETDPAETQVNNADISVEGGGLNKSADPEFADIGDTITFTIVLQNTGNVNANSVVVTDTIPQGTSFVENSVTVNGTNIPGINPESGIVVGTVQPNQVVTITFQVIVETIPDNEFVNNEAIVGYSYRVNPNEPPVEEENISNETESKVNNANLDNATKESSVEFAKVGDTVTYTFNIPNSGNVDAENVVLTDSIPEGTSFVENSVTVNGIGRPGESPETGIDIGTINPGENVVVTFKVTVESIPQSNPVQNQGDLSFEYTVDPNEPPRDGSAETNVNEFEVRDADIIPVKTADPQFGQLGNTITYTIALTNSGNVTATNVVFSDTIPNDTKFVSGSVTVNGVSRPTSNPQRGINVGAIPPNETVTITFMVTIEGLPEDKTIENIARVRYQFLVDPEGPPVMESEESEPAIVTTNSVDFDGDNFTKSVDPDFAALGDTLTYTFVLRNGGNIDANNVVLTDTIPEGTEFIEDSVTINGTTAPGANPESGISIGTIAPEEVVTVTFQVTVTSIPSVNPIKNIGRIDYTSIVDPNLPPVEGSNFSNEEETQINSADISAVKSSNPEAVAVGETVTYTLEISNSGNVAATDVVITDVLAEELQFIEGSIEINGEADPEADLSLGIEIDSIEPGETVTITYEAVLLSAPESGEVINKATVDFEFIVDPNEQPREKTVESNENILTAVIAELLVEKSADKKKVMLNETITYSVKVTNVGTVDATNVLFKDVLDPGLMYIPNSLIVDGNRINGANITNGVNIGTLKPGDVVEIEYQAKLVKVCCPGTVTNKAFVEFTYRASRNTADMRRMSNMASVTIEASITNFKQLNEDGILVIPKQKPDIEEINEVITTVEITNYRVVRTIRGTATDNTNLSGYKLVISGKLNHTVEYTANVKRQSVHSAYYEQTFSTFIILPEGFPEGSDVQIDAQIEDVTYKKLNEREIFTNVTMVLNAKVLC